MAKDGTVTVIPNDGPLWRSILYNILTTSFVLYTVIVLMRLRAAVRTKYEIPTRRCGTMEDCCCAFFCGCCTVSQLARTRTTYSTVSFLLCTIFSDVIYSKGDRLSSHGGTDKDISHLYNGLRSIPIDLPTVVASLTALCCNFIKCHSFCHLQVKDLGEETSVARHNFCRDEPIPKKSRIDSTQRSNENGEFVLEFTPIYSCQKS
jgi:hypothetical protein